MNRFLGFFIVVFLSASCKTNGHIQYSNDQRIPNETNEYFLHIKNEEDGRLTFYVTEKGSEEKLVLKNIMPGYVKWSGMYEIEYFDAPGIVPVEYDMTKDIKKISIKSINPQK